jgi:glycolate oxidase iron-sulfur subunit
MSARLRSRKAAGFRDAGADIIVTANPGCHLQYLAAVDEAGIGTCVLHLAEFLDAAQANAQRGPG